MEVKVVSGDITGLSINAIIVNLFEGVKKPGGATGTVDKALDGLITKLISEGEIKGKQNELTLIHSMGKIAPERVIVAGLGKEEKLTLSVIRGVTAEACRFLRRVGATQVATIAHGAGVGGIDAEKSAQAVTEGALLGLYLSLIHI